MVITLDLPRYRKGRVWLGHLPAARYEVVRVNEQVVVPEAAPAAESWRAAVELVLPFDSSSYGLFGAEFTPAAGGHLTIQVATGGNDSRV
jgi:hypothetical protein